MLDNIKKTLLNNIFYIIILLSIIVLFSVIGYYYYNYFIKNKINSEYVDNKEFVNKNITNDNKEATLYFFYTTWCPYCKVSKPEWDKMKEQTKGFVKNTKIIFREIDCDSNSDLADEYKIDGYPTIKLIYDNKIYDYDAKPLKETLLEFLNSVIN